MRNIFIKRTGPQRRIWHVSGVFQGTGASMSIADAPDPTGSQVQGGEP